MRIWLCSILLTVGAMAASDHPDLNGTWALDVEHSPGAKVKAETIAIKQVEDDVEISYAITEDNGKESKIEFHCLADGGQCEYKDRGQSITASFWYDNTSLMTMETRKGGKLVVKRRLQPGDDKKTLSVEVTPIAPPGKPATETYNRQ